VLFPLCRNPASCGTLIWRDKMDGGLWPLSRVQKELGGVVPLLFPLTGERWKIGV